MNHRHLLFLFVGQGEKAARFRLQRLLQGIVDTVIGEIEKADVAGGVAKLQQKLSALRRLVVVRQAENGQGGQTH